MSALMLKVIFVQINVQAYFIYCLVKSITLYAYLYVKYYSAQ